MMELGEQGEQGWMAFGLELCGEHIGWFLGFCSEFAI